MSLDRDALVRAEALRHIHWPAMERCACGEDIKVVECGCQGPDPFTLHVVRATSDLLAQHEADIRKDERERVVVAIEEYADGFVDRDHALGAAYKQGALDGLRHAAYRVRGDAR